MRNYDLQSTTQKTKDRATRAQLKAGDELRYYGRVFSSCFTSGTHHDSLVANWVIGHEWGIEQEVFMTKEHIRGLANNITNITARRIGITAIYIIVTYV